MSAAFEFIFDEIRFADGVDKNIFDGDYFSGFKGFFKFDSVGKIHKLNLERFDSDFNQTAFFIKNTVQIETFKTEILQCFDEIADIFVIIRYENVNIVGCPRITVNADRRSRRSANTGHYSHLTI